MEICKEFDMHPSEHHPVAVSMHAFKYSVVPQHQHEDRAKLKLQASDGHVGSLRTTKSLEMS